MSKRKVVFKNVEASASKAKKFHEDVNSSEVLSTGINIQAAMSSVDPSSNEMDTSMKACLSCRKKVLAQAVFCPRCRSTQFEPILEAQLTINCPGKDQPCGNKLNVDDVFCMSCGVDVDQSWFKGIDSHNTLSDKADDSKELQPDHDTRTDTTEKSSNLPMETSSAADTACISGEDQNEWDRKSKANSDVSTGTPKNQQQNNSDHSSSAENDTSHPLDSSNNDDNTSDNNTCDTDKPQYEQVFGNAGQIALNENNSQRGLDDASKKNSAQTENGNKTPTNVNKSGNEKKTNETRQKRKPNVTQNTQSSQNDPNCRRTTRSQSQAEEVEVMFHVIISDIRKHDPNEEDLYIVFGTDVLGKWNSRQWKMKRNSENRDCQEYSLSVKMRNGTFEYKYIFVDKHDADAECMYERVHFMKSRTRKADPNRILKLPVSQRSKDIWHQYDGFVYHPKPSTDWFEKIKKVFKNTKEKYKSDTRKAAEHFLPSSDEIIQSLKDPDGPVHAEDLLQKIFAVMMSLRIQMIDEHKNQTDESFFVECFDLILMPLFEELSQCVKKTVISEHALSVAICMLLIVGEKEYQINMHKYEHKMGLLFQALLLQADCENRSCSNYELMKRNFPKMEQLITSTLRQRIKEHVGIMQTDSTWLYCIPLLHFLCGDSEPFKMSNSSGHRSDKWWGLSELHHEKDILKQYTNGFSYTENWFADYTGFYYPSRVHVAASDWSIHVQTVINDLQMLFEVDYLLPRSIMAVITFGQLQWAISPGRIPPYIVAACLFYYCDLLKTRQLTPDCCDLLTSLLLDNAEQFKKRYQKELLPQTSVGKCQVIKQEFEISKTITKDLLENNIGQVKMDQLILPIVSVWNNMINLELQETELKERWEEMLLEAFKEDICLVLQETVDKLLEKGAVQKIPLQHITPGFYSKIFLVPKKDSGDLCMIHNLAYFNLHHLEPPL
ncbi:uncharacterized protein LOC121372380 [Gigantopelta aegis]|uniref:uncharacterized protein LOC121372380 n=1 Tax=Gigantopelta aegis TaxID=1735272 RepID=UPI001B88C501|nr:uncharacterized protein LOC121372380 [Gigantopelta aegis]